MRVETYIDTGILVKSYLFEVDSSRAIKIIEAAGDPVLFSHLHWIEIPNAIRLKRFRGEITLAEEARAIRNLHADIKEGRLIYPVFDLVEAFRQAERLSAKCSASLGTRSLDLLHVAAALEAGCTAFASFDERQRKAAKLAGLSVKPVD